MGLPPGFRFHPTDEELIGYYLKRKVDGLGIELEVIPVIDLYKFDPWELPDKSFLPKRDMEWFFFCPRDRKYPNGTRTNRATGSGYWKATGKDRKIVCQPSVTGLRKTLVFYRGRAPLGGRTEWVMHEYRLCEELSRGMYNFVGAFALCHVVKRNEHGQKTSDAQGESGGKRGLYSATNNTNPIASDDNRPRERNLFNRSNGSTPVTWPSENGRGTQMEPIVIDQDQTSPGGSHSLLSDSSTAFPLHGGVGSQLILRNEFPNTPIGCPLYNSMDLPLMFPPSANFSEEANQVDEFTKTGFFMPCPSPIHYYMEMCSNEGGTAFQSFEWGDSPRNTNQPINGIEAWNPVAWPSTCRQASGDWIGEPSNIWVLDDTVIVR